MSYECEKFEEIESPINCENPTLLQILEYINKLQLENKMLKADKKDLLKENLQLRNDNEILHNRLNEKCLEQYKESMESENLDYIEEYAKGFEIAGKLGYKIN